jgi:hypothetical protein
MHNIWTEITHDSRQSAKKKLKTRIQLACHINLALETIGPRKILIKATNRAYSVFKAVTAQSIYDFQDSEFRASHPQPIDNVQDPQSQLVGLRDTSRAVIQPWCNVGSFWRFGVACRWAAITWHFV